MLKEILWFLTWPLFIIVAYQLVRWLLKRVEHKLED